MDDLISRQAAIDAICEHGSDLERRGITVLSVANHKQVTVDLLENLPSAERRGRWIFNIDDKGWSWDKPYMCDQCGEWAEKEFKFCPSCGAKMKEGGE